MWLGIFKCQSIRKIANGSFYMSAKAPCVIVSLGPSPQTEAARSVGFLSVIKTRTWAVRALFHLSHSNHPGRSGKRSPEAAWSAAGRRMPPVSPGGR